MAHPELTPQLALLEEAVTILFCRIDDAYYRLNPEGRSYETLKELSDSEVMTLALFQQLRGVESERSFLREVARFFSHLFPGVVGLHPSSLHRRGYATSGATLSPCGAPSCPSWSAILRPSSSTRPCFRFRTPGKCLRARALRELRGLGGAPSLSTG